MALGSPIFPWSCEGKLGVLLESLQGQRDLIEACVQDLIFLSCIRTTEVELNIHTADTTQPQRESLLLDSKSLSTGKQQKSLPWVHTPCGRGGMVSAEA